MIYDEENFLNDTLNLFQSKLNTNINTINVRKADSITLDTIANEAYHFQNPDLAALNYRGFFIVYGYSELEPQAVQADNFLMPVQVDFEIATFDNGERDRSETLKRLLRYRRAAIELLTSNLDIYQGFTKPAIVSLEPVALNLAGRTDVLIAAGIRVKGMISAV